MSNRHVLTTADLTALRACRTLSIRSILGPDGTPVTDSATLIASVEGSGITEGHVITTFARVNAYGMDVPLLANGKLGAVLFHYPQQVTHLGSVFTLLKKGDEIAIDWGIGSHSSPALAASGIAGDSVYLLVRRTVKGQIQDLRLLLETFLATTVTTRILQPR